MAIREEALVLDMDAVTWGVDCSDMVEAGEEARGEAAPREIQIGARRWVVSMPRNQWT